MWSDWPVFCDYGFSVSALWCPLATPTILLGFFLTWTWGISSRLLLFLDEVTPPDLGHGIAPLSHRPYLERGGSSYRLCSAWSIAATMHLRGLSQPPHFFTSYYFIKNCISSFLFFNLKFSQASIIVKNVYEWLKYVVAKKGHWLFNTCVMKSNIPGNHRLPWWDYSTLFKLLTVLSLNEIIRVILKTFFKVWYYFFNIRRNI